MSKRYNFLQFTLYLFLILFNLITRFQETSGECIECLLMIILAYMWLMKPSQQRYEDWSNFVIVVCVTRFLPLLDVLAGEMDLRRWYKFWPKLVLFLPFIPVFVFENKISRRYNFEWYHVTMSHALTVMVFVYNYLKTFESPIEELHSRKDFDILNEHSSQTLMVVGWTMYFSMVVCIAISFVLIKWRANRSWEYFSVLVGIYILKGGMMVGGKFGPAVYSCLLVQAFYFGDVIFNKGSHNQQGLFLITFYVLWMM